MLDRQPATIEEFKMLIGGEWVNARSGAQLASENPYRGTVWANVPDGGPQILMQPSPLRARHCKAIGAL